MLEIFGVLSGLISIYFMIKKCKHAFSIGLINCILYLVLFFDNGLLSDCLLQIFYIPMQIIGYIQWNKPDEFKLRKESSGIKGILEFSMDLLLIYGFSIGLAGILAKYFNPNLDLLSYNAFTAILSMVAQIRLIQKRKTGWLLYILSDIVGIYVYLKIQLYYVFSLNLVYLILATNGFIYWHRPDILLWLSNRYKLLKNRLG